MAKDMTKKKMITSVGRERRFTLGAVDWAQH